MFDRLVKMATPLTCTQDSLFHIDYGTPLLAAKSTDYRTSTAKNHSFRPSIPQEFDCRVKPRLKPEHLQRDITLRNDCKSTYNAEYTEKRSKNLTNDRRAIRQELGFARIQQEQMFRQPPLVKPPPVSEMKEAYPFHPLRHRRDSNSATVQCEMPETFRPIQPDVNPSGKGFYKFLDIYLTENRAKFKQFSQNELAKAQEDFVTVYNVKGKHKGLKDALPSKPSGNNAVFDKHPFKVEFPCRALSRAPKPVPHSGLKTEYQSNYPKPECSDFYPYLQENGVYFPESLSNASPWQDLCPPAMYSTESCHLGSIQPVRAVVDVNSPLKGKVTKHESPCCGKI